MRGLYRPEFERDNCGFGLMAHMDGVSSHDLVLTAIQALSNMTHRGAVAADGKTGDGCGLLLKKPDDFFRDDAAARGIQLARNYAVACVFLNRETHLRERAMRTLEKQAEVEGLRIAGWRDVPTDPDVCGEQARKTLPAIAQLFINAPDEIEAMDFSRRLYFARRRAERQIEDKDNTFYVASLSSEVVSYKGLVMPEHLAEFYPDLLNPAFSSSICVFHQRFSTNTRCRQGRPRVPSSYRRIRKRRAGWGRVGGSFARRGESIGAWP